MRSLFTVEGLARELGRDRRTVAKALHRQAPDGRIRGRDSWFLSTALALLNRREVASPVLECLKEVERCYAAVQGALEKLRNEPDVEKRRRIVRRSPIPLGALLQAMRDAYAGTTGHDHVIGELFHNEAARVVIGEVMHLCRFRLADPKDLEEE